MLIESCLKEERERGGEGDGEEESEWELLTYSLTPLPHVTLFPGDIATLVSSLKCAKLLGNFSNLHLQIFHIKLRIQ